MGGETTHAWEQAGQTWASGLKGWISLEACWASRVDRATRGFLRTRYPVVP